MRRDSLSRPIRLALLHELLTPGRTLFDYGCGRGDDIAQLARVGFDADGWDPHHRPNVTPTAAAVVNLGYVVNVIEDPLERARTLQSAWKLAESVLVVSARLEDERDEAHVAPLQDGWVTRRGTFQKFFSHDELGGWIEGTLQSQPVAAGLGVYYVFRDAGERELYLSSRFRRPISLPRRRASDAAFEQHRDLLQPLMDFVSIRGRLPDAREIANGDELVDAFGSLRRAFRVVLVVSDEAGWERVRRERSVDLLVHLALARFHGRPRWSDLPDALQRDVRAFFPNYTKACGQADKLLFATGNPDAIRLAARASMVGKLTPTGLYVHASALHEVPALLRVYEGCARALVGTVEETTLVKLHRDEAKISYLHYPDFDKDPHPALQQSVVCDLLEQRVRMMSYRSRTNPPILHRKELFVSDRYPLREKFARLTAAEEKAGLFVSPDTIGTRDGWTAACRKAGVDLQGHRLLRSRQPQAADDSTRVEKSPTENPPKSPT